MNQSSLPVNLVPYISCPRVFPRRDLLFLTIVHPFLYGKLSDSFFFPPTPFLFEVRSCVLSAKVRILVLFFLLLLFMQLPSLLLTHLPSVLLPAYPTTGTVLLSNTPRIDPSLRSPRPALLSDLASEQLLLQVKAVRLVPRGVCLFSSTTNLRIALDLFFVFCPA